VTRVEDIVEVFDRRPGVGNNKWKNRSSLECQSPGKLLFPRMPEGKDELATIAICEARMVIVAILHNNEGRKQHDHARDQTLAVQVVRMVALETNPSDQL
jgi:hypothetical protein